MYMHRTFWGKVSITEQPAVGMTYK